MGLGVDCLKAMHINTTTLKATVEAGSVYSDGAYTTLLTLFLEEFNICGDESL